ncbi:hypothetical protein JCM19037_3339 [Geomicrobium sp. JCM 19037]|nr:hypothetical protein JCM19037_3339 [Geomicrobium sp. JCM 19037]
MILKTGDGRQCVPISFMIIAQIQHIQRGLFRQIAVAWGSNEGKKDIKKPYMCMGTVEYKW